MFSTQCTGCVKAFLQCVPLATEPGISLIILPLMRILQWNLKRTYLIVLRNVTTSYHVLEVLLFKFRCNVFIGIRIIKEMPRSVARGGTHCAIIINQTNAPLPTVLKQY
jgi:hypothetical protein